MNADEIKELAGLYDKALATVQIQESESGVRRLEEICKRLTGTCAEKEKQTEVLLALLVRETSRRQYFEGCYYVHQLLTLITSARERNKMDAGGDKEVGAKTANPIEALPRGYVAVAPKREIYGICFHAGELSANVQEIFDCYLRPGSQLIVDVSDEFGAVKSQGLRKAAIVRNPDHIIVYNLSGSIDMHCITELRVIRPDKEKKRGVGIYEPANCSELRWKDDHVLALRRTVIDTGEVHLAELTFEDNNKSHVDMRKENDTKP